MGSRPGGKTLVYSTIQKELIAPSCIRCHNEKTHKGHIVLTDYDTIMKENGPGSGDGPLIVPGRPDISMLCNVIDDGEMPMADAQNPSGSIDQSVIDDLDAWVKNGAPND